MYSILINYDEKDVIEIEDLLKSIRNVQIVDRDKLRPNGWNPNKVAEQNLELLMQSILINGFTTPIVIRKDWTILDGFHRYMISGREPLKTKLGGKVPVVIVEHADEAEDMYATVTYNRARGTHMLEPMKNIVKKLLDSGKSVQEVGKQLGMKPEEIFRLSDFTRTDFLKLMTKDVHGYSKAQGLYREH